VFSAGLGVFSTLYFSSTIISDSKTYGSIGAVLSLVTWFVAIGSVIILGAVAGTVWRDRKGNSGSERSGAGGVPVSQEAETTSTSPSMNR
jgi:uncharacterized BrkB/YihY/UPF0761 family membrane protein